MATDVYKIEGHDKDGYEILERVSGHSEAAGRVDALRADGCKVNMILVGSDLDTKREV